jgi:hypothetical protein
MKCRQPTKDALVPSAGCVGHLDRCDHSQDRENANTPATACPQPPAKPAAEPPDRLATLAGCGPGQAECPCTRRQWPGIVSSGVYACAFRHAPISFTPSAGAFCLVAVSVRLSLRATTLVLSSLPQASSAHSYPPRPRSRGSLSSLLLLFAR